VELCRECAQLSIHVLVSSVVVTVPGPRAPFNSI